MKILFITSTRVGDAILSTGLLSRLIADHPDARITIACGPAAAPLFEGVPNLERIIVLDKMVYSLHWVEMWAMTVGKFWDVLVDLRNTPMTYLLAASRRYRLTRSKDAGHRVKLLASVMGLSGEPPTPKIWLKQETRKAAEQLIPEGPKVLAIGPTANWAAKMWGAGAFVELINALGRFEREFLHERQTPLSDIIGSAAAGCFRSSRRCSSK